MMLNARAASSVCAPGDAGDAVITPGRAESGADSRHDATAMRVCVVYDCLFPYTIGGAERWYRNLAEHLAAQGHEVTYLTLRQWPRGRAAGPRRAHPGRDGGSAHGAVHVGRATAHTAAARVRAGRPLAPPAPRPPLRRGAHVRLSVLLAAVRGTRATGLFASSCWSTGSRSGAAPTGSTTSAAPRGASAGSCSASARSSPSTRSASQSCRPSACAKRDCAAR